MPLPFLVHDRAHTSSKTSHATRRPTARVVVLAAGLATLLLTACGALIPDQAVTDPFQLDGKTIAVPFPVPGALVSQAVMGTAQVSFTFPDIEWPNLPVDPAKLTNEVSIASATLDAPEATAPTEIVLSDAVMTAYMWHGADTYAEADPADRFSFVAQSQGVVTLTRQDCDATSCDYGYTGDVPAFGVAALGGSTLAAALSVSTEAPSPNGARVELSLNGEPDSLAGHTLTITVDAENGVIGF